MRLVRIWGIACTLCVFSLGFQISYLQDDLQDERHFSQQYLPTNLEEHYFEATVHSLPKLKQNSVQAILEIAQNCQGNRCRTSTGKLLVYLAIDEQSMQLQQHDRVRFRGTPKTIPAAKNPQAFNLKQYYKYKNIHQQHYMSSDSWEYIQRASPSWQTKLETARQYLLGIFKQYLSSPNEYAVAAALVLGDKSSLDAGLKNAYADTGAMHVLAVSGLHIGILLALLSFLFQYLPKKRAYKGIETLCLLGILWSFALLTGASASVLRACTMFSFVLIGRYWHRSVNIYNSLAASAFLLLLLDKNYLFQVGFQLSYVALLGIVYLYPRIERLWYIEHKIGSWIWKGIAVSLAAQLATTPISLYYFHQFPIFFWLSGLWVSLMAGIILSLGLALLVLHWIPLVNLLVGHLLYASIAVMNAGIFGIRQLPGAVWEGFWLLPLEVLIYYICLGLLLLAVYQRHFKALLGLLTCAILVLAYNNVLYTNEQQQHRLAFYHLPKGTAISCIQGQASTTFWQSPSMESTRLERAQQTHLWSLGVRHNAPFSILDSLQAQHLDYQYPYLQFRERQLFILDNQHLSRISSTPLSVDYILVRNNPHQEIISNLHQLCQFETLIIDASNSPWNVRRWTNYCKEQGIAYLSIPDQGGVEFSW